MSLSKQFRAADLENPSRSELPFIKFIRDSVDVQEHTHEDRDIPTSDGEDTPTIKSVRAPNFILF